MRQRTGRSPGATTVAGLLVGALLLAACGGGNDDDTGPPAAGGATEPTGDADWDAIVEAAREEGQLNLALHVGTGRQAWGEFATDQMRDLYGIDVTFTQAPPSDFVPRLLAEQAAGEFAWDAYIAPTGNILTGLHPVGALEPLQPIIDQLPPDNRQDEDWGGGFDFFTVPDEPTTFVHTVAITGEMFVDRDVIGDTMTGPDDMQGWLDVLDTSIIEEPLAPNGTANLLTWFLREENEDQYGEDFVRELLSSSDLTFTGTRDQLAQFLAEGRYAVSMGAREEEVYGLIDAGLGGDIEQLDWMRYPLARGFSIPTDPPHPNAAKVFFHWFLGQESQAAYAELDEPPTSNSRRLDVEDYYPDTPSPDYTDPTTFQPAIGTEDGEELLNRVLELANEILG